MAELILENVDSDVSDEEIREFLVRYGFPRFDAIEHVAGDGAHPAVLLTFNDEPSEALHMLQPRIQNLFWKNHRINAMVMHRGGS
jgi:hypothetical protein